MTTITIHINEHGGTDGSNKTRVNPLADDDTPIDEATDRWQDDDTGTDPEPIEDIDSGNDHSGEWADPPEDVVGPAMLKLSDARIAGIAIRGCFGLYHLVREHADQRTSIPPYLLEFARNYEEYIIPAAEAMYEAYFDANDERPDEIPRGLYDLGCVDCMDVDNCARYAYRLHQLLGSHTGPGPTRPPLFPIKFPATESQLLMQIMFVEYRRCVKANDRSD